MKARWRRCSSEMTVINKMIARLHYGIFSEGGASLIHSMWFNTKRLVQTATLQQTNLVCLTTHSKRHFF